VADGEHAAAQPDEPTGAHPVADRLVAQAGGKRLRDGDHAVPAGGDACDQLID
jgi:hypothetical protein